jgi:hypothetical protein
VTLVATSEQARDKLINHTQYVPSGECIKYYLHSLRQEFKNKLIYLLFFLIKEQREYNELPVLSQYTEYSQCKEFTSPQRTTSTRPYIGH